MLASAAATMVVQPHQITMAKAGSACRAASHDWLRRAKAAKTAPAKQQTTQRMIGHCRVGSASTIRNRLGTTMRATAIATPGRSSRKFSAESRPESLDALTSHHELEDRHERHAQQEIDVRIEVENPAREHPDQDERSRLQVPSDFIHDLYGAISNRTGRPCHSCALQRIFSRCDAFVLDQSILMASHEHPVCKFPGCRSHHWPGCPSYTRM